MRVMERCIPPFIHNVSMAFWPDFTTISDYYLVKCVELYNIFITDVRVFTAYSITVSP